MIEVKQLYKRFGSFEVLRGIDLVAASECTTVILGGSGQGKSVLLKHIIGILRPDAGKILVQGVDITKLAERDLNEVRKKFGMLFQDAALFDSMNVFENVAFPLIEQGEVEEQEIAVRVREALEHVNLPGIEQKWPSELSGGMRKRVGLARAIIHQPKYILYDEPTTGLDPITSNQINWLINHIRDTFGMTSIVISHDLASTRAIADRIAMLHAGRIVFEDQKDAFFDCDHEVVQNFLKGRPQQLTTET